MTTTPAPDQSGTILYPHELRRGDYVLWIDTYRAFKALVAGHLVLDGVTANVKPGRLLEVIR